MSRKYTHRGNTEGIYMYGTRNYIWSIFVFGTPEVYTYMEPDTIFVHGTVEVYLTCTEPGIIYVNGTPEVHVYTCTELGIIHVCGSPEVNT